jgi:competence protein ComEA
MSKSFVKDYLTFSRKERIGAVTIITLILASVFIPKLYHPNKLSLVADSTLIKSLDTIQQKSKPFVKEDDNFQLNSPYIPAAAEDFEEGELFDFDPNSIGAPEWKRLGLNERTTRILLNYRNKGGKFYKKEDLLNIWGMPEGFYNRIKGHIILPNRNSATYQPKTSEYPTYKPKEKAIIDINTADSLAYVALPGIGPKLSMRILKFRDKLGGFYSVDQVAEVYGLPDSTFRSILPQLTVTHPPNATFNVNTATKDELKAHPYIRWNLANAIVEYRNQHGNFIILEDLLKINLIDQKTYEKIKPYLHL